MTATDTPVQTGNGYKESGYNSNQDAQSNGASDTMAKGLGWFSIGLGLAEVLAPSALAGLIGVKDNAKTRNVLRGYGFREIGAGVALLAQPTEARWVWGRVAGDVLDLSSLASAYGSRRTDKTRLTMATAAVAGVTALDVICAKNLSSRNGHSKKEETHASRSIALQRSPEEAYAYWRNIENLPTFMTYLKSVRVIADRRSHWIAMGPMGTEIEWDAEIVRDEPNRLISWRSTSGIFQNAGTVRFEKAPGNRGSLVKVDMDLAPHGGAMSSMAGKIMGPDIGRRIMHDLRNFKQVLELGEVTQSDSSIHSGLHAAQPSEDTRSQQ